jgi:hypothetical protein
MTIAKVTNSLYGVALSTIYYHAQVVEAEDTMLIKATIRDLILNGKTTGQVAKEWGVPLATVNRLYIGKRVV